MSKKFLYQLCVLACLCGCLLGIASLQAGSLTTGQQSTTGEDDSFISSIVPILSLLLTSDETEEIGVYASANPSSGLAPLTASFSAQAQLKGKITSSSWDFDYSGVTPAWDWQGVLPEPQSYTYTSPGTYTALIQVEDDLGNTESDQVIVIVADKAPFVTFETNADNLLSGQSADLSWAVSDVETVTIDQGIGTVAAFGTMTVSPTVSTTYTLTAIGAGGTIIRTVDLHVLKPASEELVVYINSPTENKSISDASVTVSGIINQSNADVWVNGMPAVLSGNSFSVLIDLVPGVNTITATASYNSLLTHDSTWVTRWYTYEPQPAGSFGETYEDLIPDDAGKPGYDKERFSIIRGQVEDEGTSPIATVIVSIKDHPEYGTVRTDSEGLFSIPVEGGTDYTLVYQHENYITAHRKENIPANDIAVISLIRLVALDSAVTTVVFNQDPETVVVHESSMVSDDDGTRSLTMVFQGDNKAFEVDEHGQRIRELSSIDTRGTEFTTPETMPAILPPNSAFTYCSELSVDGVESVQFEKPVVSYVDNFIGFDVGMAVPVGYYDREKGEWVASDNGVVVRLLDTDSDGVVDALDSDGDGAPNDLNSSSTFDDEVIGLDNPSRYAPNSTFWRVEVSHFTPWDYNWPYGPPEDAIAPNPESDPSVDEREEPPVDICEDEFSSSIEARSRVYRDDVSIPGTSMKLHYTSSRVPGYKTVLTIPVSGATVPDSLERIDLIIKVAGRTFEHSLPAEPHQKYTFVWDGLDYRDEAVNKTSPVSVDIGFVYKAVYYSPGDFERSFGQAGSELTAYQGRQEIVRWKRWYYDVTPEVNLNGTIAEGWTISSHHTTQFPNPTTLLKGDGEIMRLADNIVDTIAGNGSEGFSGDGGPAINASFNSARDITVDAEGNIYLVDFKNYRIRKIDTDGFISTIIGDGVYEYSGDGGLAVNARIGNVWAITTDVKGNIYFSETLLVDSITTGVVRKIDTNGIVTTIAGNGTPGFSGDNGPATEAQLRSGSGLAVDKEGNVYIADIGTRHIRKVDTNGIITTIAGNGSYDEGEDGSFAINVGMRPRGLALDSKGNIYINLLTQIRKIDTSGIITTIAGNDGSEYFSGDGGPATSAEILATNMAVDAIGNVFITNEDNVDWDNPGEIGTGRIRVIDTHGIIYTLAGTNFGDFDFGSDGGSATKTYFGYLDGITFDFQGNILVVEDDPTNLNISRVRKITTKGTVPGLDGDIFYPDKNGLGYRIAWDGQHKETIDLDTGVTLQAFGYDVEERLISITDQFGNETSFQYDGSGLPISITSPEGLVTGLTVDGNNHLTRISYPDGGSYAYAYDASGLIQTKTEPAGNIYNYTFDANGRLERASDEEGGQWDYTRLNEVSGKVTSQVLSAENNTTTYENSTIQGGDRQSINTYPSGNTSAVTWTDGGLTQSSDLSCEMQQNVKYTSDPYYNTLYAAQIESVTPAGLSKIKTIARSYQDTDDDNAADLITTELSTNGKTTTEIHNTLLSQEVIRSPEDREITISYDPVTLLPTQKSMTGLLDETYAHDSSGRITSLSQGTRTAAVTYDEKGFMESLEIPGGQITTYSYDLVGRVTEVKQPGDNATGYSYDANGNLSTITTPKGVTHSFTTNKVNKSAGYMLPDAGGGYSFVYDNDRRLTNVTFPSTGQFTHTYTDNRLTSSQTSDGVAVSFEYLAGNRMQTATRASEVVGYTYDGSLLVNTAFTGTLNQSVAMIHDADHLLTNLTYAGGSQGYAYNLDGLLTTVGSHTITRNSATGLPEQVSDTVSVLARTFSEYGERDGENSTVNSVTVSDWTITTRDLNSRITEKEETINGAGPHTFSYTYDDLGRLLTVSKDSSLTEEYQYDANGNRTSDKDGVSYVYDSQDRLVSRGTSTYDYSADGFLQSKTESTDVIAYTYSLRGDLLEVVLPDNRSIKYTYDPFGRRIAKSINDVIVEKYLWWGNTTLLAVYDGSDNLLMRFEYAEGRLPVSMNKEGVMYSLTYDSTGSLRVIADANGVVVKSVEYSSFGAVIDDTDSAFSVPLGFAGGLFDTDTGLLHFGVRDYDPSIGRWTAKDPLFFAGGDSNFYAYALNDPINRIDPDGKESFFSSSTSSNGLTGMIMKYFFGMHRNTLHEISDATKTVEKGRNDLDRVNNCEETYDIEKNQRERKKNIDKNLDIAEKAWNWGSFSFNFSSGNPLEAAVNIGGDKLREQAGKVFSGDDGKRTK